MTNYDDSSALMRKILDDPMDFLSYLALADWHEEQGNLADSEAWRWLGTKKRCSQQIHKNSPTKCLGGYWWAHAPTSYSKYKDMGEVIPKILLFKIEDDDGDIGERFGFARFDKQIKAIFALMYSFKNLTPEEKEACWRWEP